MDFQPKKKLNPSPSALLCSRTESLPTPFSFAAMAEEEDNKGEFWFHHD